MRTVLLSFLILSLFAGDAPVPQIVGRQTGEVGGLGLIDRMEFTGNATFPAADLRQALAIDADLLIAAHPRAPLGAFLGTLAQRTVTGYQACGFPRVTAQAVIRQDHVVVQIVEGLRYTAGQVIVRGARSIPAERIISGLTTPQSPRRAWYLKPSKDDQETAGTPNDPLWEVGRPAHCDDASVANLKEEVTRCYAHQGRMKATVSTALDFRPDQRVDLQITVADEGQEAVLGEVVFHGLKGNDRATLERFLEISNGMPVDTGTQEAIESRLRSSGRFTAQKAVLEPIGNEPTRFRLVVTVTESRSAPPFPKELSATDAILLRAHGWMMEWWRSGSEDLVLTYDDTQDLAGLAVRLVLSPRRGFILSTEPPAASPDRWRSALAIIDHRISISSSGLGRGLRSTISESLFLQVMWVGESEHLPDTPNDLDSKSVSIQLGWRSDHGRGPLMSLQIDPNPILNLGHHRKTGMTGDGQAMTIDVDDLHARVHAASGRLEEMTWTTNTPGGTRRLHLSFATGALDRELTAQATWDGKLSWGQEDADGTLVGMGDLLLAETQLMIPRLHVGDNPVIRRYERMLQGGLELLHALQTPRGGIATPAEPAADTRKAGFFIPADELMKDKPMTWLLAWAAGRLGRLGGDLPIDSWPVMLLRDACCVIQGNTRYLDPDLKQLTASEEFGPIGCLCMGSAAGMISKPHATYFGQLGLSRLDDTHAAADFRLLHPYAGTLVKALAAVAGQGPLLLDLLPPDRLDAGRGLFARLRAQHQAGVKPEEVLDTLCLGLWQLAFKECVRKELQKLAPPPEEPGTTTGAQGF